MITVGVFDMTGVLLLTYQAPAVPRAGEMLDIGQPGQRPDVRPVLSVLWAISGAVALEVGPPALTDEEAAQVLETRRAHEEKKA